MFSAASITHSPGGLAATECCAGVGYGKNNLSTVWERPLIKLQMKRVTRTGQSIGCLLLRLRRAYVLPGIEPSGSHRRVKRQHRSSQW